MLLSHQSFSFPELGTHYRWWGISSRSLFVRVVRAKGGSFDERLVPNLGFGRHPSRPVVGVILAGRCHIDTGDGCLQDLPPGNWLVAPGRSSFRSVSRAEPDGETYSLTLEWKGTRVEHHQTGVVKKPKRLAAAVDRLCQFITLVWSGGATRQVLESPLEDLLSILRSEGFRCASEDDPHRVQDAEAHANLQQVSRALDLTLSTVGELPALVDVERRAHCSARTFQRRLPAVCRALGQTEEGFRDMKNRVRMVQTLQALGSVDGRTERVSDALGYSSPSAMCRALRNFGLSSPQTIRKHLATFA